MDSRELDLLELTEDACGPSASGLPAAGDLASATGYATGITDAKSALSVAFTESLLDRVALEDLCYALYPNMSPPSPPREGDSTDSPRAADSPRAKAMKAVVGS